MDTRPLYFNHDDMPSELPAVLDRYGLKELMSPTRSTVPLVAFLRHGGAVLEEVLTGIGAPEGGRFHLEYEVNPAVGKGNASHTDLMIRTKTVSLAIEAKWTEPPYDTVGAWRRKGKSRENREAVLTSWLDMIRERVPSAAPTAAAFSGCTYQMVHRAASACYQTEEASLAYLQFTPLPGGAEPATDRLREDMRRLNAALGKSDDFALYLVQVKAVPTEAYRAIEILPKRSYDTAHAVREALLGEPLFQFESSVVEKIA